jgi:hypothetical protein
MDDSSSGGSHADSDPELGGAVHSAWLQKSTGELHVDVQLFMMVPCGLPGLERCSEIK